jgi:hypothetical protein
LNQLIAHMAGIFAWGNRIIDAMSSGEQVRSVPDRQRDAVGPLSNARRTPQGERGATATGSTVTR